MAVARCALGLRVRVDDKPAALSLLATQMHHYHSCAGDTHTNNIKHTHNNNNSSNNNTLTKLTIALFHHIQVSTIDLVTPQSLGLRMLLLCSGAGCQPWLQAAQHLQQQGAPLAVLQVLPQGTVLLQETGNDGDTAETQREWEQSALPCTNQEQQQQQRRLDALSKAVDIMGTWADLHMGYGGAAVLVRPDGHVAWQQRWRAPFLEKQQEHVQQQVTSDSATAQLHWVLQGVLHLRPAGPCG